MRNVIQMAVELQFFLKILQKIAHPRGLRPQTLVCDTFKCTSLLAISRNLQFFENFSSFGLSPDPL